MARMTKEERLRMQMERLAEMKKTEERLHAEGIRYVAGVDEVGRGPLAGPVVAAAVVLPEDFDVPGVDDSKKLTEKRREELYEIIMERALAVGIGQRSNEVIDEINILQATKQAMYDALEEAALDLIRRREQRAEEGPEDGAREETEDGRAPFDMRSEGIGCVLLDAVHLPDLEIPQQSIIKGDAKVLCIAAASIVAKVTRDRMMIGYAEKYPWYAFESNKGYGTKAHYEGIREHGTTPIHRMSFLNNMH